MTSRPVVPGCVRQPSRRRPARSSCASRARQRPVHRKAASTNADVHRQLASGRGLRQSASCGRSEKREGDQQPSTCAPLCSARSGQVFGSLPTAGQRRGDRSAVPRGNHLVGRPPAVGSITSASRSRGGEGVGSGRNSGHPPRTCACPGRLATQHSTTSAEDRLDACASAPHRAWVVRAADVEDHRVLSVDLHDQVQVGDRRWVLRGSLVDVVQASGLGGGADTLPRTRTQRRPSCWVVGVAKSSTRSFRAQLQPYVGVAPAAPGPRQCGPRVLQHRARTWPGALRITRSTAEHPFGGHTARNRSPDVVDDLAFFQAPAAPHGRPAGADSAKAVPRQGNRCHPRAWYLSKDRAAGAQQDVDQRVKASARKIENRPAARCRDHPAAQSTSRYPVASGRTPPPAVRSSGEMQVAAGFLVHFAGGGVEARREPAGRLHSWSPPASASICRMRWVRSTSRVLRKRPAGGSPARPCRR